MLKFLQNTGLTDIRFIIINSKQTANDYGSLVELVKDSGIKVYQETNQVPIWRILEGGKDDMFVYDRCGRLTYYVPYPLSALHDIPIVHTTLLSSYFDHPCGKICPPRSHNQSSLLVGRKLVPPIDSLLDGYNKHNKSGLNISTVGAKKGKSGSNLDVKKSTKVNHHQLSKNIEKEIYDNQLIPHVDDDKKKTIIDLNPSKDDNQLLEGSGGSGSGSGDSPMITVTDQRNDYNVADVSKSTTIQPKVMVKIQTTVESNDSLSLTNISSLSLSPPEHSVSPHEPFGVRSVWKIWQFFVGGTGNESSPVPSAGNETSSSLPSSRVKSSLSVSSSMLFNSSNLSVFRKKPLTFDGKDRNLTTNGTENWLLNGKRCIGFDKSVCVDISVSKLLRARLCCLNEVSGNLLGPGKGFRCAGYTKSICNKMFPLIKCCLKDFHHILGKYLNANSFQSPSSNIG